MGYLVPGVMLKHEFSNFELSLSKERSFLGGTFYLCWEMLNCVTFVQKLQIHLPHTKARFATWQNAQQVNKSMFDVWLCGAAGCAVIHRV